MWLAGCATPHHTQVDDLQSKTLEPHIMNPEAHHYLGIEMNQQVWKLLAQEDRDNRRMEHFALASLYHWEQSPKFAPINAQRGHWLLARVYAVLARSDEALLHAEKCMSLTRELDLKDFDLAYAHEGLARAHASAGNTDMAEEHYQLAAEAGEAITGDKDKEVFMGDLEGQPWFGMEVSLSR